ncbi:MAG: YbaK/EbsC family protein [Anaerolineae bacterium]
MAKKGSVEKVRQYFKERGLDIEVFELDKSTRTAQLAAEAVGTELGSIVKSLIFLADGKPALVLVAGDKRADPEKIKKLLGAREVAIANADQVREKTGFAIGGVPPLGHDVEMKTLIDRSLGRFETVYAAAGSPQAVFPIAYKLLVELSGGEVVDVTQ